MTATGLDLFCGAGGSSTGLVGAGMQVILAANHWPLAVEVHQLNHPDADHDCADISAVDPRRYPATDVLWASPECTNHSVAKGVKRATGQVDLFGSNEPDPSAERSRATMWDVPRFAEVALMRGRPYRAIIVENVVDAVKWLFWRPWLATMDAAGYSHKVVYLNSAFAHGKDYNGAPQYRDRIYVVFWRKGATAPDLDIRPPAWCPACETRVDAVQSWKKPFEEPWGRYRAQYVYRCATCRCEVEPLALPAAAAIDWSDLGGLIGERSKPLAPATRERIRAGLARYGRPFGAAVGGNTWERRPGVRTWPVDRPRPVVTATGEANALTVPMLVPAGGTWNEAAQPVSIPMRARTTRETEGVVVPPFLAPLRSGRARTSEATEPLATVVANGSNHAFVVPPMIVPVEGRDGLRPRLAGEPMRTRTGRLEDAVVTGGPFITMLRQNVGPSGVDEPLDTVVAAGNHHALTVPDALLTAYYTTRGSCTHVAEPVPTLPTRDRFALVTRAPSEVGDDELDACSFRMLAPGEVLAAMAFPRDYLMKGVKRDRVRMAGNAVTPPAARLIAERVLAAMEADR